jgi:hypothetical protein
MKKFFFIFSAWCMVSLNSLEAQTSRGNALLGLSSSFNMMGSAFSPLNLGYSRISYQGKGSGFAKPADIKVLSLNSMPRLGYFVMDNIALGMEIYLAASIQKGGTYEKYKDLLYCAGPFIRIYGPPANVMLFIDSGYGIGAGTTSWVESGGAKGDSKAKLLNYYLSPGVTFLVGERISFDISGIYNVFSVEDTKDNPYNIRVVNETIGLRFGMTLFFGKNSSSK